MSAQDNVEQSIIGRIDTGTYRGALVEDVQLDHPELSVAQVNDCIDRMIANGDIVEAHPKQERTEHSIYAKCFNPNKSANIEGYWAAAQGKAWKDCPYAEADENRPPRYECPRRYWMQGYEEGGGKMPSWEDELPAELSVERYADQFLEADIEAAAPRDPFDLTLRDDPSAHDEEPEVDEIMKLISRKKE
jgi:hypothetical protein